MESGTAFPVDFSCEFFLWGLCSCMEELCLPGKKLLLPEGIALARRELLLPEGIVLVREITSHETLSF